MRFALALLVCALPVAAQETFKSDVRLVNVSFNVRDARGALVTNLTPDEFEVREDGVVQKIAFFGRGADVPLRLGLLVDASGSQKEFVRQQQRDLETFLKQVLTPRDSAFVLGFANSLRLAADFSSSGQRIVREFEQWDKHRAGYPTLGPVETRILGTALYDAIYHAVHEKLATAETGQRAILIFSDGEDNSSAFHMLDAIEAAQGAGVRLYSLRYTEARRGVLNARNKYGIRVLRRLAQETGGADYDAREGGLARHFKSIGEELRTSYELAYHSTNSAADDTFRKISVTAKRPGLTVRAKTGYYSR